MSRHIAKLFKAPLVLASAAFVVHIGTASAAESKADIQQQMRDLLSGTPATHFVLPSGPSDSRVTTPAVDSQEFAKRLLLGTAAYPVAGRSEVSGPSGKAQAQNRPGDMQAAMRQVLLGQPHAYDAS
jgi:hypothetical protein